MNLLVINDVARSNRTVALSESSIGAEKAIKSWDELTSSDWDKALRESPYIEVVGAMHIELIMTFGGYFDHVRCGFFECGPRIAQWFAPIHQRYRWYPPRGSSLFEAGDLNETLMGLLRERGPRGEAHVHLLTECGYDIPGLGFAGARFVGVILPEGDKALLFIGLPGEGNGRYERIPWLHAVLRAPFDGVRGEWRDLVRESWDDAWARKKTKETGRTSPQGTRKVSGREKRVGCVADARPF